MSRLEIILSAMLLLSVCLSGGLFIYSRNVVSKLLFIASELGDLQVMIDSFCSHLTAVYELESFYGDETLQHLLEHSNSLNEHLLTFEEIYSLPEENPIEYQETSTAIQAQTEENSA